MLSCWVVFGGRITSDRCLKKGWIFHANIEHVFVGVAGQTAGQSSTPNRVILRGEAVGFFVSQALFPF